MDVSSGAFPSTTSTRIKSRRLSTTESSRSRCRNRLRSSGR
jgi:hypothetical protein